MMPSMKISSPGVGCLRVPLVKLPDLFGRGNQEYACANPSLGRRDQSLDGSIPQPLYEVLLGPPVNPGFCGGKRNPQLACKLLSAQTIHFSQRKCFTILRWRRFHDRERVGEELLA